MRFLRSNTAVIITVGPFYDKTDGVTIENALTATNERITLTADTDAGSAPTLILDNITGAAASTANDIVVITNGDAGLYQMELAAADVNRVGRMFLSITDAANHVPVFHEFFVLPAPIYDWLTGVIVPLPANVTQLLGTAWLAPGTAGTPDVNVKLISADATAADNAEAFFDGTGYAGIGNVIPTVTTLTGHTAQTGDGFARLGAPAGASVSADVAAVKVDTAAILVDTGTTLDGRIPAALTAGGFIKADVLAISGSTAGADQLEESTEAIGYGTCDALGSTTAVIASSITPASAVNDQYNGRVMIFKNDTTTAALRGQATTISDYVHATLTFTVVALTTAPVSGDTFSIL